MVNGQEILRGTLEDGTSIDGSLDSVGGTPYSTSLTNQGDAEEFSITNVPTSLPEPSSWLMMATAALAGLGFWTRRRARSNSYPAKSGHGTGSSTTWPSP